MLHLLGHIQGRRDAWLSHEPTVLAIYIAPFASLAIPSGTCQDMSLLNVLDLEARH